MLEMYPLLVFKARTQLEWLLTFFPPSISKLQWISLKVILHFLYNSLCALCRKQAIFVVSHTPSISPPLPVSSLLNLSNKGKKYPPPQNRTKCYCSMRDTLDTCNAEENSSVLATQASWLYGWQWQTAHNFSSLCININGLQSSLCWSPDFSTSRLTLWFQVDCLYGCWMYKHAIWCRHSWFL